MPNWWNPPKVVDNVYFYRVIDLVKCKKGYISVQVKVGAGLTGKGTGKVEVGH